MAKYQPYPHTYPSMWNFQPDDAEDYFYIRDEATIKEITERALDYWGVAGFTGIRIIPENIHTRCVTYDRHDPSDWDNFLKIERIEE